MRMHDRFMGTEDTCVILLPKTVERGSLPTPHGFYPRAFNAPATFFNVHSSRHSYSLASTVLGIMAIGILFERLSEAFLASLRDCMVPLAGECPAHCVEPSARTATGRRCSLLSCIEFSQGIHCSNSRFCTGRNAGPQLLLNQPDVLHFGDSPPFTSCSSAEAAPKTPVKATAMPRLRPRMTARRGSSRGGSAGERPSSSRPATEIPFDFAYVPLPTRRPLNALN